MNLPHLQPMLDQELHEAAERVLKRRGEPMPWRYTATAKQFPEHGVEVRAVFLEEEIYNTWAGSKERPQIFGRRTLLAVERAYWMRDPPTIIVTECG